MVAESAEKLYEEMVNRSGKTLQTLVELSQLSGMTRRETIETMVNSMCIRSVARIESILPQLNEWSEKGPQEFITNMSMSENQQMLAEYEICILTHIIVSLLEELDPEANNG